MIQSASVTISRRTAEMALESLGLRIRSQAVVSAERELDSAIVRDTRIADLERHARSDGRAGVRDLDWHLDPEEVTP